MAKIVLRGALAATGLGALMLLLPHKDASAHSFYDYSCCQDRDCHPVDFTEIQVTPQGYVIKATGVVLPFGDRRIKMTPAEDTQQRYHLCTTTGKQNGMVLCLYVPQGGV